MNVADYFLGLWLSGKRFVFSLIRVSLTTTPILHLPAFSQDSTGKNTVHVWHSRGFIISQIQQQSYLIMEWERGKQSLLGKLTALKTHNHVNKNGKYRSI